MNTDNDAISPAHRIESLTHYGLVMPHGYINLDQHYLK